MRVSSASLVTAEPGAIYGAIITADRLLYHPANILGTNPIAALPLHTSSRHGSSQGGSDEFLLRSAGIPAEVWLCSSRKKQVCEKAPMQPTLPWVVWGKAGAGEARNSADEAGIME